MFAIIELAGKQFQVKEQDEIIVPRLSNEVGEKLTCDRVLLLDHKGKTQIGRPTVENAKVSATILDHGKDKKIIIFKKKRRKDYMRKTGHRQDFTLIRIDKISAAKSKTKKQDKSEEPENGS